MLIVTATNITGGNGTAEDGTADYDVWVGINQVCIWQGPIAGHVRVDGAAALLRHIATAMDNHPRSQPASHDFIPAYEELVGDSRTPENPSPNERQYDTGDAWAKCDPPSE
jgi:hypothetical protein